MKAIYEFYWNCGRMGDVSATFVETKENVAKLLAYDGDIYFGEILGKHSEVYGKVKPEHITLITDDQEFIDKFEEIMGESWSTGNNPFEHLPEDFDEYDPEQDLDTDDDLMYENLDQNN